MASEESYVYIHIEYTKVHQKCQKWFILASFWKPEACSQTVLPDRSILIGQKLAENAKIENLKRDIFGDFQTIWVAFRHAIFGILILKCTSTITLILILFFSPRLVICNIECCAHGKY